MGENTHNQLRPSLHTTVHDAARPVLMLHKSLSAARARRKLPRPMQRRPLTPAAARTHAETRRAGNRCTCEHGGGGDGGGGDGDGSGASLGVRAPPARRSHDALTVFRICTCPAMSNEKDGRDDIGAAANAATPWRRRRASRARSSRPRPRPRAPASDTRAEVTNAAGGLTPTEIYGTFVPPPRGKPVESGKQPKNALETATCSKPTTGRAHAAGGPAQAPRDARRACDKEAEADAPPANK